jgi:hypothetical protein
MSDSPNSMNLCGFPLWRVQSSTHKERCNVSDIIEPAPILDIFAQDMPRMERLGPCTRLIFTVKYNSAYNEGERVVVAKLIIPTENLRAIASALLAAETGQGIAEAAPAGEMR